MTPRNRIIPIFIPHLGCPHDCVFCNQKRISGAQDPASAETVGKAISQAVSGAPEGTAFEAAFYGGSFTAIPAHEQELLLGAVLPFLVSGKVTSIRLSTRPDAIDEAVLERLRQYNVGTVELGAQSMDEGVLQASGRGHSPQDVVRASELIRGAGFKLVLQMMTGLPGDDPDKDRETARRFIAMRPNAVRIYPTVIVRDTALFDMWRAGKYAEHTVDAAVGVCAKIVPMFEEAGIPVIRIGLNPTDELSGGSAAGGAYHPALGELVRSRVMRARAETLLESVPPGADVTLGVHRSRVSAMTGQHRENLRWLTDRFSLVSLKVSPLDIGENEIAIIGLAIR